MEAAREKWEQIGSPHLLKLVSDEDASLIAKHIDIPLLDDLSPEEKAKVINEDQEKYYFSWSILEVGKFPNVTPTLIYQDCYPHYGSRHTEYVINLKTGKPTEKSPVKTPLPPDICARICERTKIYYDYLKLIHPPDYVPIPLRCMLMGSPQKLKPKLKLSDI